MRKVLASYSPLGFALVKKTPNHNISVVLGGVLWDPWTRSLVLVRKQLFLVIWCESSGGHR